MRGENGVIRSEGAEGAAVEVYNAAGVCVFNGTATEVPVPQRGIYVVRVSGHVTKIVLYRLIIYKDLGHNCRFID